MAETRHSAIIYMDATARMRYLQAYKEYTRIPTAIAHANHGRAPRNVIEDLRRELKRTVDDYAGTETRMLLDEMNNRLTHQMRDIVYGQLWDPRITNQVFQDVLDQKLQEAPWSWPCRDYPCQCFKIDETPLWVQHQVVGITMAREVITAYYAVMPPGRLGANLLSLRDCLTRGHFHLNLTPANFIRHLRITISPVHTSALGIEINGHVNISSEGHVIINTELQSLQTIRDKTGFRLTIVLSDGIWGEWTEQTLERLRDTYAALTQAGMRVRIYGYPNRSTQPIVWIDRFFPMGLEKWYTFCDLYRSLSDDTVGEQPSDDDAASDSALTSLV